MQPRLQRPHEIKKMREMLNDTTFWRFTIWNGSGRPIANDWNAQWLFAHIAMVLDTPDVKRLIQTPQEVIDRICDSATGVVAFAILGDYVYTIIRYDTGE